MLQFLPMRRINLTNGEDALQTAIEQLRCKHRDVYIIVSPPRCASTAFARMFWEHPSVAYYCHEPFDTVYHQHSSLVQVIHSLNQPLVIADLAKTHCKTGNNLVIKEMTFQVNTYFQTLVSVTDHPIIFLMRDPRLSILSRMNCLRVSAGNPFFLSRESGWLDLLLQVNTCKLLHIPYIIVDTSHFRANPQQIGASVFQSSGLDFSPAVLSWRALNDIELGQLGSQQELWYQRVLKSTGVQEPVESVPDIEQFTEEAGFRAHVIEALTIYRDLLQDEHSTTPGRP